MGALALRTNHVGYSFNKFIYEHEFASASFFMKDSTKRITWLFLVIALLPVAFVIYELSLLNQNEKMVRETYRNQLDAILYSVNQYSDDLINSWANRVRQELQRTDEWLPDWSIRLQTVLNQREVVPYVYLTDLQGNSKLVSLAEDTTADLSTTEMDMVMKKEAETITRLIKYESAGFRKAEALNYRVLGRYVPVLFTLDPAGEYKAAVLLLDVRLFIVNSLAPKMQTISQEEFIISALKVDGDTVIYSTELTASADEIRESARTFKEELSATKFSALPGYYFGIMLKGATLDDLVKERTQTTLFILILFTALLGGGIWFLYRNIRREMLLSQAKSEFVSNVSHEIRTPLSLIGMFAETLEAGRVTSEEKKKEYYTIITKEAARLSRIVNRILNFSQLEANKKAFHFAPVQVNEVCREVLSNYTDQLKEKGFDLAFKPGDLPLIKADKEALAEVIINVVDNAVKYSRDRKKISISTERTGNLVRVAIADSGIGIAKEHQREIFDQFFRVPLGDVHSTKGSGLGLTLVKRIMLAHGGDVVVESELNKGSVFILTFPVSKEDRYEP